MSCAKNKKNNTFKNVGGGSPAEEAVFPVGIIPNLFLVLNFGRLHTNININLFFLISYIHKIKNAPNLFIIFFITFLASSTSPSSSTSTSRSSPSQPFVESPRATDLYRPPNPPLPPPIHYKNHTSLSLPLTSTFATTISSF